MKLDFLGIFVTARAIVEKRSLNVDLSKRQERRWTIQELFGFLSASLAMQSSAIKFMLRDFKFDDSKCFTLSTSNCKKLLFFSVFLGELQILHFSLFSSIASKK